MVEVIKIFNIIKFFITKSPLKYFIIVEFFYEKIAPKYVKITYELFKKEV